MTKVHAYTVTTTWTGNLGRGTADYGAYERDNRIEAAGKAAIDGSSDPAFRGDPTRWNPEELFLASLSTCHMLWYLHLCARARITVQSYEDDAEGQMAEDADGGGRFLRVILHPRVALSAGNQERALELHEEAHRKCFIANSVACRVEVRPLFEEAADSR